MVTVTDDDGGAASQSFQFGVARIHVVPSINLGSNGEIPVKVFSDPGFDAGRVDPASLHFGPGGALEDHGKIHGDSGFVMTHYRTQESGIRPTDTVAFLTGQLLDGTYFVGMDTITIVPGGNSSPPLTSPPGATKFFVVDPVSDATYRYTASGALSGSFGIDTAVPSSRGVASNAAGDTLWVIDGQTHQVAVQGPDGSQRGSWRAQAGQ